MLYSTASMADISQYVSVTDFARLTGVSRAAVWLAIKRGAIQAEKVGRGYFITKSQVQKYKEVMRNYPRK